MSQEKNIFSNNNCDSVQQDFNCKNVKEISSVQQSLETNLNVDENYDQQIVEKRNCSSVNSLIDSKKEENPKPFKQTENKLSKDGDSEKESEKHKQSENISSSNDEDDESEKKREVGVQTEKIESSDDEDDESEKKNAESKKKREVAVQTEKIESLDDESEEEQEQEKMCQFLLKKRNRYI
jgi:hypothetical protein